MGFFRNVTGVLLTSTAMIPIGFVTSIVLARYLSVEDRGLYAIATTFAAVAVLLGQLGWPPASIYRLRHVRSEPAHVAGAGVLAVAGLSTVVLLVCWTSKPFFVERFFEGAPSGIFFLVLAIIPLQLLAVVMGAIARGIDRFRFWNWHELLLTAGILVGMLLAIVVADGGLIAALTVVLVTRLLAVAGLVVAVLRETRFSLRIRTAEIRESARFGLKTYVWALAGQIHERIDVFMIAYFLADPAQLAYYAIAAGLVRQLKILPGSIGAAAFPQLASLNERDAANFMCRISRQSIVWVVLAALALGSSAHLLVPLFYGDEYRASIAPFLVLLPGMALLTIYHIQSRYFVATDRQGVNILTQTFSVLLNILLNLWLIPRYGILGAAWASLVSYSCEVVLITTVFVSISGRNVHQLFVPRSADFEPYRRRLSLFLDRFRAAP